MVRIPVLPVQTLRSYQNVSFLKNPSVATKIVDNLTYNYDSSTLSILDVYPGSLLFSSALHNSLQPKQHILLESRLNLCKHIESTLSQLNHIPEAKGNTFQFIKQNPYNWETYLDITNEETGILHPGFESRDHIHSKLLLAGYVSEESLLMQWLACLGNQNWIQRFGNVRMLLWVPEASAIKVLAGPGTPARHKCSLVRESFSETRLIATPETPKVSKLEEAIKLNNSLVFDPGDLTSVPMSLLEINPKDNTIGNMFSWDYVTKNLMIVRTKTVAESVRNLGPGAEEYYQEKLPKSLLKRRVKDLEAPDFQLIAEYFDLWPFKPETLIDDIE